MIKDFVLTSDYPIDQVVYRSDIIPVTAQGYNTSRVNIAHGVGQEFLPIGQYSLSGDFSSNVFGVGSSEAGPGGILKFSTRLGVSSSTMAIEVVNQTQSTETLYFRAIGLAIEGTHRPFASTSHYHDLTFNTDTNQLKLVDSGSAVVGSNASVSIPHSLGYIPTALVWQSSWLGITLVDYVSVENELFGQNVFIDSQNIIISRQGLEGTSTYYYRIYADE